MQRALMVDDSKTFCGQLSRKIASATGLPVDVAGTRAEALQLLDENGGDYVVGLIDLHLPDADDGEAIDDVLNRGIAAIVLTGEVDSQARDRFWGKKIIDYVQKESVQIFDYIVSLIERVMRNPDIKVMAVDDSSVSRTIIANLLRTHRYQVVEAHDGVMAMEIFRKHPDIKLVVTDCVMPRMDGIDLTGELRRIRTREDLCIIGVSSQGDAAMSARFIKKGANDYLSKPFVSEEFYCRINQNIETLERIEQIREFANTDHLTRLYNRRYFFEIAGKYFAQTKREPLNLAVALLDIDHFKKINDSFGHDAGDEVLRHLGAILARRFRETDVVARFGGEEFCVLLRNLNPDKAMDIFEGLRAEIEASPASNFGASIPFTASIGVCPTTLSHMDEMLKLADTMLYEAKHSGRNRVVVAG